VPDGQRPFAEKVNESPTGVAPHSSYARLSYNDPPRGQEASWGQDPDRVRQTLSGPGAEVVPLWRDRCLVNEERTRLPAGAADGKSVLAAASELVLLFARDGEAVFAADLSQLSEDEALATAGANRSVGVRGLVAQVPGPESAVLARATGLLHFHRNQRFCGGCGSATRSRPDGQSRLCSGESCGKELFPRLEPAVIVLVEAPGPDPACLLARHHGAGEDSYSLLAGFVEVGDSLEGAVRRELAEEAGVVVDTVTYQASQAWPFPAGVMIGFRAVARTADIQVDHRELREARWFTREQVAERAARGPGLGPADSLGHVLLDTWLHESR
jgi:NAD+ diphosphatase